MEVIKFLLESRNVVLLDNRFLDPLGLPNVYSTDGATVSSSLLQLEAMSCNGSYHRDIRLVLELKYPISNSTNEGALFCEIIVECKEVHISRHAVNGDGTQWNEKVGGGSVKKVPATQSELSRTSKVMETHRKYEYKGIIQDYFTKHRSWSRILAGRFMLISCDLHVKLVVMLIDRV